MLALALGKTLEEINRMTPAERVSWREFFVLYPFDDFHRFHRPAAMLAGSYPGLKNPNEVIDARLQWLAPSAVAPAIEFAGADLSIIKALGGVPPQHFAKA